jgi:sulfate permease, SulP family
MRLGAPLFDANAQSVRDAVAARVREAAPGAPVTAVVRDLNESDGLDITSSEHLVKLARNLRRDGVALCLARVHAPVLDTAKRAGVVDEIGADRQFPTIEAAVAWAEGSAPTSRGPL